MKRCKICDTLNPDDASFCTKCGNPFDFSSVRNGYSYDDTYDNSEDIFWNANKSTITGCRIYLSIYPEGRYAGEALLRIKQIKQRIWIVVIGGILIPISVILFLGIRVMLDNSKEIVLSDNEGKQKNELCNLTDTISSDNVYLNGETENQFNDSISHAPNKSCVVISKSINVEEADNTKSTLSEKNNSDIKIAPISKGSSELEKYVYIEAGTLRNYGYVYGWDEDIFEQMVENIKLDSYYISKYDVIQCEYEKLMGGNPSSQKNDSFPIMGISFIDALKYCNKLSKINGYDGFYSIKGDSVFFNILGNGFRLPTRYEYAFAARDRKENAYKYAAGDKLSEIAWHAGNSKGKVHKIAQKKCNELGLYDMVGNVYKYLWSDDKSRINVWYVGGSYQLYSYSLYTFREYHVVGGGNNDDVGIRLVFTPRNMQCNNIQTNRWIKVRQR